MENKYAGYILIGVSILVLINILSFNSILNSANNSFCTAESCPYHESFNKILYMSLGTIGLLLIVGLTLIFSKPEKDTIIKEIEIEKPKKEIDTSELTSEERLVLKLIQENKAIFQADLIEKTGYGKVKMTRIIDRLEGKDIVERKRRGMTNIVVMRE